MINHQDPICLRTGERKILFQKKEQQENDHTEYEIMRMYHLQSGFLNKSMDLGKFPIKYPADQLEDGI